MKQESNAQREFLTTTEVGYALGVSAGRVYQMIAAGELPGVRMGRSVRIPRDAWEAWVRERNGEAAAHATSAAR